jgi:hypothetical protein
MSSAMMTIADHMSSDFLDAVREAEMADEKAAKEIVKDMNEAWADFDRKEALLNSKSEQAVRTLIEIQDLRDVNHTTYTRRLEALKAMLNDFIQRKDTAPETIQINQPNVVKLGA